MNSFIVDDDYYDTDDDYPSAEDVVDDNPTLRRSKRKRNSTSDSDSSTRPAKKPRSHSISRSRSMIFDTDYMTDEELQRLEPEMKLLEADIMRNNITPLDIIRAQLPRHEKRELLELLNVATIYRREPSMAYEELKLIRKIRDRVQAKTNITDQDQMILDQIEHINQADITIETKIIRCNRPIEVKAKLWKRYNDVKTLEPDSEQYVKTIEWIEHVLACPTEVVNLNELHKSSGALLSSLYTRMTAHFYGQLRVVEKLLEIVSAIWTNPHAKRKVIVFAGPPGVGKTYIAKLLGEIIGIPSYMMSFGGAKDPSWLKGHGFTYIGAQPGEIYKAICTLAKLNGILIMDEFDKATIEIYESLLHALDNSQNSEFIDRYIGLPCDLSKTLFIAAVNDINKVDPTLLNRCEIIHFDEYTLEDKINIGHDYILPRLMANLNIPEGSVIITRTRMEQIIRLSKVNEPGVRQTERNIANILARINTLMQIQQSRRTHVPLSYAIKNFRIPFKPSEDDIKTLFVEELR